MEKLKWQRYGRYGRIAVAEDDRYFFGYKLKKGDVYGIDAVSAFVVPSIEAIRGSGCQENAKIAIYRDNPNRGWSMQYEYNLTTYTAYKLYKKAHHLERTYYINMYSPRNPLANGHGTIAYENM